MTEARGIRLPRLYPIVNVADPGPAAVERAFALAIELASAGCTLLQLRAKPLGAGAMTVLATRLVGALEGSGARLLINDRVDVALAAGAAGVHLGDEDLPVEHARRLFDGTIGWSTHSPEEAAAAGDLPADYIGFGPVFDSPTKAGVRDARGLAALEQACRTSRLPVVAIGGVTLETAPACWRAGAASVAVIREIEDTRDRTALVAAYREAARRCEESSPVPG